MPNIPKGWKECSKHGNKIDGTPFVAFKIPIIGTKWDLDKLMATIPNMNLMISLQTDKEGQFYKQEHVEGRHGVKYTFCHRVWSGKIPRNGSCTND